MLSRAVRGAFGEYEWFFYNCSHFVKGKRCFLCWLQDQATIVLLFISPTCNDQITKLRHTQSPRLLLLCRTAIAISQFEMWHRPVLNGISEFCLFSWSKKVFWQHTGTSRGNRRGNAAGRVWTWCCSSLLQLSEQQQTCCV